MCFLHIPFPLLRIYLRAICIIRGWDYVHSTLIFYQKEAHMTQNSLKMKVEIPGLQNGDDLGQLQQAARFVQLLEQVPVEISFTKGCKIEIDGRRIDIFGVAAPGEAFKIKDPAKVKSISVKNGITELEVDCKDISLVVLHSRYQGAAKTSARPAPAGQKKTAPPSPAARPAPAPSSLPAVGESRIAQPLSWRAG